MSARRTDTELPGLDLDALRPWFVEVVPDAPAEDLAAELIAGGKSNLTYRLRAGERTWILRRPPLGHVLATAHDMGREYTVISALEPTPVPVPVTYALHTDPDLLGAPFYLMSDVAGRPYRHASELAPLGPERTRAISIGLVDTLAALHAVDPDAVGLSDFGRPDGFLARQVRRWKKQLDASYSRDLPAADELHARLERQVPTQSAAGIVHGDFRLDNLLTDEADRPAAVIDWEMATLGDPLTDVALMLLYHRLGDLRGELVTDAASAPGFLTEAEILERYAAGSDRDLSAFGFYLGLAAYKLAAILEGIHYRHLHGQTVGPGFEHVGDGIHTLLEIGLDALPDR